MAGPSLIARAWTPEDVQAFAPSIAASPFGPLEGPADVLLGSMLHAWTHDGRRALIASRLEQLQHGRRLTVTGLVSEADRLDSAALCAAVDSLAAAVQADQLCMATMRPHIERAAIRNGWERSGAVLRKGVSGVFQ